MLTPGFLSTMTNRKKPSDCSRDKPNMNLKWTKLGPQQPQFDGDDRSLVQVKVHKHQIRIHCEDSRLVERLSRP